MPAVAETIITRVTLNREEKGDFFVERTSSGDFLVKVADLRSMGFREPTGISTTIDGEPYLSLRSMTGPAFVFEEDSLTLAITAPPALLGKTIIDFKSPPSHKVYYPKDSSVFLNYGVDYTAGDRFSFTALNVANQVGARVGDVLFLSDANFTKNQAHERFVRLQSSIIHDDRRELRRFIAGDFFASSGELGSSLNLGGLSFAKIYRIDPYFINYPTISLTGQVGLPSEANIYLNGALVKTEKLSPGEFELRNMSYYGGAGNIDIVLKDAFGREQRLNYPFYYGDSFLLRKGLQEYSYNLGFIRKQFGSESNHYGSLAFSAFHRYGVSDFLTLGFRAEAGNNLYNLGPRATLVPGNAGIFSLSLAGSTGRSSNTGGAALATYLYQGLHAGVRAALAGYTRDYATIASENMVNRAKYEASAGVSYTDRLLGSLSLDYTTAGKYGGTNLQTAAVGYTRNLTGEITLTATYRRTKERDSTDAFFVSVNYNPKANLYFSASYETQKDVTSELLDVQKNPPVGEGLGYRATVGRTEARGSTSYTVNPSLQYNARYGIYRGEFNSQRLEGRWSEQYRLSAAGSLVYVGDTFGLTRPVYDSFGLVKVGDLEGIKVLVNTEEIGTTDSAGRLFIPNLGSYYENQVAINDKQIPIDYYLSDVLKLVSPPLRSGSCITFAAKKLQPITGTLKIRTNGEIKPLEFLEATLAVNGREITFPTGTGGEFYIDISQSEEFKKLEAEESGCASMAAGVAPFLKPGTYRAALTYLGKPYTFDLVIPPSTDPIIDLGQIVVGTSQESGSEPTVTSPVPEKRTEKAPPVAEATPMVTPTPAAAAAEASAQAASFEAGPQKKSAQTIHPLAAETIAKGSESPSEPPPPEETVPPQPANVEELPATEVYFRFGTADFTSASDRTALFDVSRLLKSSPDSCIIIDGHTDQVGSRPYNQKLSRKRALAIARALEYSGIAREKIVKLRGFGKKKLKCRSLAESCRKWNRRGVLRVVPCPGQDHQGSE